MTRKRLRIGRPVACALLLTAILSVGNVPGGASAHALLRTQKEKPSYTLLRVYKKGDIDRYKIETTVRAESGPEPEASKMAMLFVLRFKETTELATKEGISKVASEFENASIQTGGEQKDITATLPKFTTTRRKNGVIDGDGGDTGALDDIEWIILDIVRNYAQFLPPRPVQIGEKWEMDFDRDLVNRPESKVTLLSVNTMHGIEVAKLQAEMDYVGYAKNLVHVNALLLVERKTGKTLDLSYKMESDARPGKTLITVRSRMLAASDRGAKETFRLDGHLDQP